MKKYTNKILIITTALVLVASTVFFFIKVSEIKKKIAETTQVLVVGTIHESHETNPNYSYQDIINILGTYNPEVICVEIPPAIFRKELHLKEMVLASIYGFDHNIKVYPIGWQINDRDIESEREAYMLTDDYITKEQIAKSLIQSNRVIHNFVDEYGDMKDILNENKMSYDFFNGWNYDNYFCESDKISISVFGNSCINYFSETRNAEMMKLINRVIKENKGKRIMILTGLEHKHYFDQVLSLQDNVYVLKLKMILPLKNIPATKNMAEYLEKNSPKGYYDNTSNNINQ
ncbi:MAG: hypothetical protein FWC10_06130 [Lentimicrobiaceae bacterium]|nr:hypothetical protein [Lentimicrobiaceae bacterium]